MAITFTPIALDVDSGDDAGVLVLRDEALIAVAAELGPMHGDLTGSWYVEAVFHASVEAPREPFADLAALRGWLIEALNGPRPATQRD